MKKIKIPRRDHEVYFIPVPETLKPKQTRSFVVGQMEKLHPGFSGESALDIKRLVLDKTRWLMVTVMKAETMAEYRVLHKGRVFFTNTSMAVHKKDFIRGGVRTIADERIGYDSESKTPVSNPIESGPPEPGRADASESPPGAVKNVARKCGVFARKRPAWRVAAMIACAALSVLIPLFFFPAAKEAEETLKVPFVAEKAEFARVPKYPPPAIEILAGLSADLVEKGARITRWQYNENQYNEAPGPLLIIETRGIDVLSLRKIFGQYEYLVLDDIPDVRYIDGEPCLTVFLNAAGKGYLTPHTGTFFSQSFSLPIFSDLTGELRRHEVPVVSETLPSAENGNALYTFTYTAKDRALIRSMEVITGICDKYPVRVKGMDVSIGGEGNGFTVVCSLAQSDAPRYAESGLGDGKAKTARESIPLAFGYKEPPPPPPPPKAVTAQAQTPQVQKQPEVSIVGTIRDDRGQTLFYREAGDSKIKSTTSP